jgi:hypothetical protein
MSRHPEIPPIIRKMMLVTLVYTLGMLAVLFGTRPTLYWFLSLLVVVTLVYVVVQVRLIRQVRAIMKGNP